MIQPKSIETAAKFTYSRQLSGYDEAYQDAQTMSAHWQKIISLIGEHSPSHLQQRLTKLERI